MPIVTVGRSFGCLLVLSVDGSFHQPVGRSQSVSQ